MPVYEQNCPLRKSLHKFKPPCARCFLIVSSYSIYQVTFYAPRFAGSNTAEDYEFLRVIKVRNTTTFGREVKPWVSCHKILQYVKAPYNIQDIFVVKVHGRFSPTSSCFDAKYLCWLLSELWRVNQELLELKWKSKTDQ
jgi:hypothetical protein